MAVLTAIDDEDARNVLALHGLPIAAAAQVEGIPAGSVNSNFALVAGDGRRLFLRLYEEQDLAGAEREAAMLARLAQAGVPTPAPLPRLDGRWVSTVRGKPAALFPWRDGTMRCQAGVTRQDAARVGEALARVHVAGAGEPAAEGRFGPRELRARLDRIEAEGGAAFAPHVPGLRAALEETDGARDPGLARGLTHGDLFRDNVLWGDGGDVAALLDFESACAAPYVYDLMVTVLAWCFGDDLDGGLASAMREGYERVRPLDERDRRGLWAEASFGALRFTVTRITDYAMRTGAHGARVVKDWRRFSKRFDTLQRLGPEGLRALLGA